MSDRALRVVWFLAATLSPLLLEHSGRPRRTRCGRIGPGSMIVELSACRLRAGREIFDLSLESVESSRHPASSLEHLVSAVLDFHPHRSPGNLASPLDGPGLCGILGLVRRSCLVRASRSPSLLLLRWG